MTNNCINQLVDAGISWMDAEELRRIAMTLHRWHELECGDSNDYQSVALVRGTRLLRQGTFEYQDDGKPYLEVHPHRDNKPHYRPIPDRERGALKRLAKIMARYPGFASYVQGDPRGASLYILRPDDMNGIAADKIEAHYNRGIGVCK